MEDNIFQTLHIWDLYITSTPSICFFQVECTKYKFLCLEDLSLEIVVAHI